MPSVNMRSSAQTVPGQGVGSCYEELTSLLLRELSDEFEIYENSKKICDIMHYHTVNLEYYAERLTRGRRAVNVAFVHFLPETLKGSLRLNPLYFSVFSKYLIHFYNSMDYLVAVNPEVMDKLRRYDLNRPKLVYIPNFVSPERFRPEPERRAEFRAEFGIAPDAFAVVGAGQLQTRKGIFDFAETARLCPETSFIWAGGFSFGRWSDGHDAIKRLTRNPPDNLRFVGMVERSRMNALYNACDMMFLPSFDELFPMTILEAVACGKPILLRDVDVYRGILGGMYAKADGPAGFAGRIREMASDAGAYARYAEASRRAAQEYGEPRAIAAWRGFYREILRRNDPSGAREFSLET
ncbi:MAG: glycosyltransferase family 4 protein [Clostridiales bacterium]|jgi:1,2-diacylglycerol-3-alpha-glucose alpha-1,2-galactosyltransferase|nr:glycosyltransferase family 4 protein [Clostridiales bacterium]